MKNFLLSGGIYTTLDVPGATGNTVARGINNAGQIVGSPGFLLSGGTYTTINVPGARFTEADGINDVGQIVGLYSDATGTHGFLATPTTTVPEPGTLTLTLLGIGTLGVCQLRKRRMMAK